MFPYKRIVSRQPPQAVRLNNPKTARLIDVWNFSVGNTGLLTSAPTVTTASSLEVRRSGRGRVYTGGAKVDVCAHNEAHNITGPMSAVFVFETFGNIAGGEHLLCIKEDSSGSWYNMPFAFYKQNSGALKLGRASGTSRGWAISQETFGDNVVLNVVVTSDTSLAGSGASAKTNFYCNGRKLTTVADYEDGTSSAISGNTSGVRFGQSLTNSANTYLNGAIYAAGIMSGAMAESEAIALSRNPWQIFAPRTDYIFPSVTGGSPDATGTGSVTAITTVAPTATANGSGVASGSTTTVALSPPTGTGTGDGTAAANLSAISLSSPTGSATGTSAGNGNGIGSLTAITTTAPSAAATGSGVASGSLVLVSLAAPTAAANGSGIASGAVAQITLSAPTGSATGTVSGDAVGTGAPSPIVISAALATGIGTAVATGGVQSIGLTAPTGTAHASAPGGVTLSQPDIDAIAAAVWAYTQRKLTAPGNDDVADALLNRTWP